MADTTEFRSPPYYSTGHHTFEKNKPILRLQSNPHFSFLVIFLELQSPFFLFSISYYISQWVAEDTTKALVRISHRSLRSHQQAIELFIPRNPNLISDIHTFPQTHRIHGQRRLQRSPLAERTRRLQLSPRYYYYQPSRHGQKSSAQTPTRPWISYSFSFSSPHAPTLPPPPHSRAHHSPHPQRDPPTPPSPKNRNPGTERRSLTGCFILILAPIPNHR